MVPINPQLLLERARNYNSGYDVSILLKSARGIYRNAEIFEKEALKEDAFILYSRFVDLIVNKINNMHQFKEMKRVKGPQYYEYNELVKMLGSAMDKSEELMKELKDEYDHYIVTEREKEEIRSLQKKKLQERKVRRTSSGVGKVDDHELIRKLRNLAISDNHSSKAITNETKLVYNTIKIGTDSKIDKAEILEGNSDSYKREESPVVLADHKIVNFTEGGVPLRTVFLPFGIVDKFLKVSNENSLNNLETCGILIGKLIKNAFFINNLVIPEQDNTSDTCMTKNEETLFEFIENEDPELFILGWIHTHPTQSCFMSSVDLHTQNSYQIMLNESISIVCAVDQKFDKRIGVFRLTDPPGVPTITNCNKSGFHLHEEDNLYIDCNRVSSKDIKSGHVVVKHEIDFKYTDLRK